MPLLKGQRHFKNCLYTCVCRWFGQKTRSAAPKARGDSFGLARILRRPTLELNSSHLSSPQSPAMGTLSLLSYNLQGLTKPKSRTTLNSFLHANLRRLPDVFAFQEHKLREGRTDCLQFNIWRAAHFIICPALDGVHARQNDRVLGGKGGLGLALHP
jgi:hypothetical protein